jgi:GNAT superfamily N-acetyltransferase
MLVRRYQPGDREAALGLAPRLTVGVAPWRDPEAVLDAVRSWVRDAVASTEEGHAVFVAENRSGRLVGLVGVGRCTHFSGAVDGYVGELVVSEDHEGQGVGRALMAAAEQWAVERGLTRMTLETGAGNAGARAFYRRLGYVEEEVRLTRRLERSRPGG